MSTLWILGATIVVSLVSFIGAMSLALKEKWLDNILLLFVGLSAGSLLGGAFLHLLPEASVEIGEIAFVYVLVGFIIFFILEKLLHWHHHHKAKGGCSKNSLGYMNVTGDALHNFIDGLVISAAFLTDINLGVVTTIAVMLHEIPQEISDFGVLLYSGFSKLKALFLNFLSALFAVLGAVIGILFLPKLDLVTPILLAVTAGGFIYIAASDLIPEINKGGRSIKSVASFIIFIIGIFLMYLIKFIFEG